MLEIVLKDLAETIRINALQSVINGAVLIGGYVILKAAYLYLNNKRPDMNLSNIAGKYIFACYIMYVLYLVLFSREPGSREGVNLELFGTYSESPRAQAYMVENILLLIPFGFLLPFLSRRLATFTSALTLGLIFSLIIETTQYITKRGYFQADDIWLNTVGAVIGFITAFTLMQVLRFLKSQKLHSEMPSHRNIK